LSEYLWSILSILTTFFGSSFFNSTFGGATYTGAGYNTGCCYSVRTVVTPIGIYSFTLYWLERPVGESTWSANT